MQPHELIVPYVRQPEEEIPGKPLFFATAMTLGGVATGLLVESHEGRPTKVEGNPDHPGEPGRDRPVRAGLGAHALRSRIARSRSCSSARFARGARSSPRCAAACRRRRRRKGAGLRILTETVASPTLAAQIQQVLAQHPEREVDSVGAGAPRQRARRRPRSRSASTSSRSTTSRKADVVLSLDADFLSSDGAANLRYMRQFASRRRVEDNADNLNRLYVVEADAHR